MNFFEIQNTVFSIFDSPVSYIEMFGTLFGLLSVYLATKANVLTWCTGIINEFFLFILFFQNQLYADMFLQIYFLVITVYGWYNWNRKKTENKISEISFRNKIFITVIIILATIIMYYIFANIHLYLPIYFKSESSYPLADSFIMVSSIVAIILLTKKKIENWYLWIIIDLVCICLYFKKELYFLCFEYIIFLGFAYYGLYYWKKIVE